MDQDEINRKLDQLLGNQVHIFDADEVDEIRKAIEFSKEFRGHRVELMRMAVAYRQAEGFAKTVGFLVKTIPIIVAIWVIWNTNAERAMEWARGWGLGK